MSSFGDKSCFKTLVLRRSIPVLVGTTEGTIYSYWMKTKFEKHRYSKVIISIVHLNGEHEVCCLLDTGCTKSMILKKVTYLKQHTKMFRERHY